LTSEAYQSDRKYLAVIQAEKEDLTVKN
jgi:hypothetical protein